MRIPKIITALMVFVSLSAAADFQTVELAYEVALSDLQVPVTSTGTVIFRECSECDPKVVLMTRHTQFLINGQVVELKEFRKNVFKIRQRDNKAVTIKHHLATDTITSISVAL
jgi:hypothetical protein